jgi:PIN domain nuclease of toxin-antitoxin system
LVDSHIALWFLMDDARLAPVRDELLDADAMYFSPVTPWELGIKRASGHIDYPDDFVAHLRGSGVDEIPITSVHAEAAARLPRHHADPFDRMLIAQAQTERLTLVSADRWFRSYDVELLDASV